MMTIFKLHILFPLARRRCLGPSSVSVPSGRQLSKIAPWDPVFAGVSYTSFPFRTSLCFCQRYRPCSPPNFCFYHLLLWYTFTFTAMFTFPWGIICSLCRDSSSTSRDMEDVIISTSWNRFQITCSEPGSNYQGVFFFFSALFPLSQYLSQNNLRARVLSSFATMNCLMKSRHLARNLNLGELC